MSPAKNIAARKPISASAASSIAISERWPSFTNAIERGERQHDLQHDEPHGDRRDQPVAELRGRVGVDHPVEPLGEVTARAAVVHRPALHRRGRLEPELVEDRRADVDDVDEARVPRPVRLREPGPHTGGPQARRRSAGRGRGAATARPRAPRRASGSTRCRSSPTRSSVCCSTRALHDRTRVRATASGWYSRSRSRSLASTSTTARPSGSRPTCGRTRRARGRVRAGCRTAPPDRA